MQLISKQMSWILHVSFWILFNTAYLLLILQVFPLHQAFLRMTYSFILFAALAYSNWFYLIPKLFYSKKYKQYFLIAIVLIICFGLMRVWIENSSMNLLPIVSKFPALRYSFILISLFIIWVLSSLFRLLEDFLITTRRESELKTSKLETELKLLKSQINPHFLFNTLNNIYTLVYLKSDIAAPMLLKLSGILRYMLYETEVTKVPILKEIEYLRDCIDLHVLNPQDRAKVKTAFNIKTAEVCIEPFLFINFLENSFKHGALSDEGGYIHLAIDVLKDQIHFDLKNNTTTELLAREFGGIGLSNTIKRLELLYPEKHQLNIISNDHLYHVQLHINI